MDAPGELSHEESCLLLNAGEHDLLPGVLHDWRTDQQPEEQLSHLPLLADALLGLVDRGVVEVRRLSPDLAAAGSYEVLDREDLAEVLADPATWQYTDRGWSHRDEGVCIVRTR
ncbi:hypothetical protein [Catellatospora sp. TT07R-123]|uniref:hypothetical protein n=1 Tax=Catellatospora sp. TT07R-123 TaxID=2733863 RepID=UPI001BB331D0|nr:hypothetical protein [Catellatospora sp. TT07R-123]